MIGKPMEHLIPREAEKTRKHEKKNSYFTCKHKAGSRLFL